MTQRLATGILVITFLVVLFNALQTSKVAIRMEDQSELSGQYVESHGCHTERLEGESLDSWKARHLEAVSLFNLKQQGE